MTLTAVDKSLDSAGLNALWADIAVQIKTEVGAEAYDRWFREIEPVELDEKALTLRVPNNIYQLWIESNFQAQLRSVVMLAASGPRAIKYVFRDPTEVPLPGQTPAGSKTKGQPLDLGLPVA